MTKAERGTREVFGIFSLKRLVPQLINLRRINLRHTFGESRHQKITDLRHIFAELKFID